MNSDEKHQSILVLMILSIFLVIGVYLSPIFEEIVLLSKQSIILGIGLIILYASYRKIVEISYKNPEMDLVKYNFGALALYTVLTGLIIYFCSYYFVHIFGYEESYKNFYNGKTLTDLLNRNVNNVEEYQYTFDVKNGLIYENYKWVFYIVAFISIGLYLKMAKNFMPTKLKENINKKLNKELFDLKNDYEYTASKVVANQPKSFNLSDWKAFNMKDPKRIRVIDGGKKIPGIFDHEIFHEKHPIWIFNKEKRERVVNPIVFELLNDPFNKLKITKISLEEFEKSKDKNNRVMKLILNKLYKQYLNGAGEKGLTKEFLFNKFENQVEFVILELAYLNEIVLSNFALGQIYRFAKTNDHIRELLSAIDNSHMKYLKFTGIYFYMKYSLFKEKKEREIEMDQLKNKDKKEDKNSFRISFE